MLSDWMSYFILKHMCASDSVSYIQVIAHLLQYTHTQNMVAVL